mmetsp:Transcript_62690/g.149555  ORF Transcript_62690/g.149555 Transcript_62690/m.149555 type:complete len:1261 (-) Transcript_62690:115-3897(-)
MGAPQLALLRDVVGQSHPEAVLQAALRDAGGDLARAANLILDGPGIFRLVTAPVKASTTIDLDDSDSDVDVKTDQQVAAVIKAAPTIGQDNKDLVPEPALKRARTESNSKPAPTERSSRIGNDIQWSFLLGEVEVNGYSTTRSPVQRLLRTGAVLGLHFSIETKKPKGRRFSSADAAPSLEGGTIKFDLNGEEVGRLPVSVAKILVPVYMRRLVDVEAKVGRDPPVELSLGISVPIILSITVRSSALSLPSKATAANATGQLSASPLLPDAPSAKGMSKGHKAVLREEAEREVLSAATAQLLSFMNLKRRRSALDDLATPATAGQADAGNSSEVADQGALQQEDTTEGGAGEDTVAEMTCEAAAQLGSSEALERSDLPAMALKDGLFGASLRRYQAQAVFWMWQRENPTSQLPPTWLQHQQAEGGDALAQGGHSKKRSDHPEEAERPLHPMWDEYELLAPVRPPPGEPKLATCLYHHRTSGSLSLEFPDAAHAYCRGGVLADDMGLGKTVMCLALLATDAGSDIPTSRAAAPRIAMEEDASLVRQQKSLLWSSATKSLVGGTLVVAPLSLISQWNAEIERHFPATHRPSVHQYHGAGRSRTPEQLRAVGVVLTTYNTLAAEKTDGSLFQVYWQRIILDEAHSIKNRCTSMAQAAFRLRGLCRWCVTGTPLQNSIDELYSLVKFLRLDPWGSWSAWRQAVAMPLQKGDSKSVTAALDAARRIIQPLLLRRTKATRDPHTGELLLVLPPKHVHVLELQLSPAERDFYDALYRSSKTQFDTFVERGEALQRYTHILQLILKLRQALCHPFLVFARAGASDNDLRAVEQRCMRDLAGSEATERFMGNLIEELRQGQLADCPICCDTPEDPTMTPCGHIFCRECAYKALDRCNGECPVCRKPGIERRALTVLPGATRFPARLLGRQSDGTCAGDGDGGKPDGSVPPSTKMRELVKLLEADMAAGRRAVVFSQWTSFLDLIQGALDGAKIPWRRFDGSLSVAERKDRVAWLGAPSEEGEGEGRALLVSLKAGGVGLNLVAASRLYLLDLWWNPAVEEQAIQRVHRIGQTKEVHVYKFVVDDSMDAGILELQKAKARLFEQAVSSGSPTEAVTKLSLSDLRRLFSPGKSALATSRAQLAAEASAADGAANSGAAAFAAAPSLTVPMPEDGSSEQQQPQVVDVTQPLATQGLPPTAQCSPEADGAVAAPEDRPAEEFLPPLRPMSGSEQAQGTSADDVAMEPEPVLDQEEEDVNVLRWDAMPMDDDDD